MRMNGKMQKTMLRVLSVMLAASFLLAGLSLVWPASVSAEYRRVCGEDMQGCYEWWCEGTTLHLREWWYIYQGSGGHCTYDECKYERLHDHFECK